MSKKYERTVLDLLLDGFNTPLYFPLLAKKGLVTVELYGTLNISIRRAVQHRVYIAVAKSNDHFDPANIETVKELIS